jgi:epoxyqueuosine reductase
MEVTTSPAERTRWICERARAIGFDLCGVAPAKAEGWRELEHLPEWLARGYAGEMRYLEDPRRGDPAHVMPDVKNVIVVALNYNTANPHSYSAAAGAAAAPGEPLEARGWISRYAWGDDYHEVLKKKLDLLLAEMRKEFAKPFDARAYVDTGPILERLAAKYAGLGWLGKNTLLINQQLGSWLFLGVIITTLDLEPTLAKGRGPAPDMCGSCTRCLDACPTAAFPQPYVLDARRCISYLTIELRGTVPEELRSQMGRMVVGCDICQDVCPWNRKSPLTDMVAFQPREFGSADSVDEGAGSQRSLIDPELEWLLSLTQQQFSEIFRGSAVKRTKWRGLVRNACIAAGNSDVRSDAAAHVRIVELLDLLVSSDDALIAEHARWARERLHSSEQTRSGSVESTATDDASKG